ncbi:unnamed protein product, partial [Effrenium voratum]
MVVNGLTDAEGWRYARHFGREAPWRNTFQPQMFVRRRCYVGRPLNEGKPSKEPASFSGAEEPPRQASASRTPRPSLSPDAVRRETSTASTAEGKGLEFGLARTPFHDMYQQYLLRFAFLQRQMEYWMDWYERRKNLLLGATRPTQNFALLFVLLLLLASWLLPTRYLCLAFIYAIFWDGLGVGRLMREHRKAFVESLKAPATSGSMFKRFVEPGRLALITYGPCAGKMCTIVDIVDQKRVVVDGPESLTGVRRHMMPIKRLSLTDIRAPMGRGTREKFLKKALAEGDVLKKWSETNWAKKLKAQETRKNMSDFERFKVMCAKQKRSKEVKKDHAIANWLESEDAKSRVAAWGMRTTLDELVDEGVQHLQLRDWIRKEYFAGRPMLQLRLIQRCRTLRDLAMHVTTMSDCFTKRRQRQR